MSGSRYESYELDVREAVENGNSQGCAELIDKWLKLTGTFVGSFDIEVSTDGTVWSKVTTGLTAAGWTAITQTCKFVRIATTAYTSGTPRAVLTGRMAHYG